MVSDDLRAAVRDAISTEWHRRIAEQIADTPDGHVDALTDAVMSVFPGDPPPPSPAPCPFLSPRG